MKYAGIQKGPHASYKWLKNKLARFILEIYVCASLKVKTYLLVGYLLLNIFILL